MSLALMRQPDPAKGRATNSKKEPTVEPNVIDEEMLRKGVVEPVNPDGSLLDPKQFPEVTSLAISFMSL